MTELIENCERCGLLLEEPVEDRGFFEFCWDCQEDMVSDIFDAETQIYDD